MHLGFDPEPREDGLRDDAYSMLQAGRAIFFSVSVGRAAYRKYTVSWPRRGCCSERCVEGCGEPLTDRI